MIRFASSSRFFHFIKVILPCLLTGGLLLAVYAAFGFYPFGEKSIAWCDMNQQVIPLTAEFRNVLLGKGSMFRSPGAGGINFWGIFFFFLSSPFSFLAVFSEPEHLPWFMNWMLVWKMMVCAGTSSFFFCRLQNGGKSLPASLCGVLYAFSGYALMYYQNIVWLDMMALFPLLLLAIIRLERKRDLFPFVLVFSAMLIVHYYLSYMIVLFLLFGYGLYLFMQSNTQRRGESALLLGIGALLSVLITAVVWLPSLLQVFRSARGDGLVKGIASGDFASQLFTTLPTIFTAAIPFAALFFLKKSKLRTGLMSVVIGMISLLLLPILIQPINKMWHTGSYQGFPTRYGYMIGFLLILMGFWIVRSIAPSHPPMRTKPIAGIITAGFSIGYLVLVLIILADYLPTFSVYSKSLWGNEGSFLALLAMLLAAIAIYALLLGLWQAGKLSRRFFTAAAAFVIFCECFFNASVYIGDAAQSQQTYRQIMELEDQIPEDGFYRVKASRKYFDVNLLSAMGYESLAHYTSLTPETTLISQRRLGYSGYWMEVGSDGGTAFSDAILGNKYVILPNTSIPSSVTPVYIGEKFAIIPQKYRLPDTILTDTDPGFLEDLPAGSRMDIQQQIAEALFPDSDQLFFRYQPDEVEDITISNGRYIPDSGKTGTLRWEIPITEPVTLYFDCAAAPSNALTEKVNKSCNIRVNGTLFRQDYPSKAENGILCLGSFSEGIVEVTVEIDKDIQPESFELFGMRDSVLEDICNNAEGAELSGSGSHFSAQVTAKAGQTLFIPLSYDPGWKATVNGKSVPISRTAGNYLSLPMEEGDNQIVLTYTPPGFRIGALLSLTGILLAVCFFRFRKQLCRLRILRSAALLLFSAAAIGAAIVVYLVPVAIWILF
ncbi:MAG: YfhO family protein [Candidatus Merdivicinus sp.]|jgi:uncharacterized membrane protein YfhO